MKKKIVVSCLILSVLLITGTLGAQVIVNHMMTRDPNQGTGCQTPTPNYSFFARYSRAPIHHFVSVNLTL